MPRRASAAPFLCLIVAHFECPDISQILSKTLAATGKEHSRKGTSSVAALSPNATTTSIGMSCGLSGVMRDDARTTNRVQDAGFKKVCHLCHFCRLYHPPRASSEGLIISYNDYRLNGVSAPSLGFAVAFPPRPPAEARHAGLAGNRKSARTALGFPRQGGRPSPPARHARRRCLSPQGRGDDLPAIACHCSGELCSPKFPSRAQLAATKDCRSPTPWLRRARPPQTGLTVVPPSCRGRSVATRKSPWPACAGT